MSKESRKAASSKKKKHIQESPDKQLAQEQKLTASIAEWARGLNNIQEQQRRLDFEAQKTILVGKEISATNDWTFYSQVGKMFMQQPKVSILESIKNEGKRQEGEIARLRLQQAQASVKLKSAQQDLGEFRKNAKRRQ
eukprot:GHVL01007279.1.p1 GENE.GHVL01007279.1~~GHVL01007279.1.p1  ORF type:complete len:138 (-),score=32.45 GHVL01007279.1:331-744(-)